MFLRNKFHSPWIFSDTRHKDSACLYNIGPILSNKVIGEKRKEHSQQAFNIGWHKERLTLSYKKARPSIVQLLYSHHISKASTTMRFVGSTVYITTITANDGLKPFNASLQTLLSTPAASSFLSICKCAQQFHAVFIDPTCELTR